MHALSEYSIDLRSPSIPRVMTHSKAKRTRLTFSDKFQILDMLATGSSDGEIVSTFGISIRSLRDLKKDGPSLRQRFNLRTTLRERKSARVGRYPELEAAVMEYVSRCRELKFPVSRDIIRIRATMVKEKIMSDQSTEGTKRQHLSKFVASDGWCSKFIQRHDLNSKALHGEAGSADVEKAKEQMSIVRERLAKYSAHEIYNVDETALFYKLLPRRTYVLPSENGRHLRGILKMKAKDRVSAYLCTNADRSLKNFIFRMRTTIPSKELLIYSPNGLISRIAKKDGSQYFLH